MAKGYSYDLRLRVIQSVEEGMSPKKASEIYKISRKVIYDWKQLKLKTGDVKRKEGYQTGHRSIIKDRQALAKFLEQNPNKTGAELARAWPDSISVSSMNKTLRRFGFSYKKNISSPKKKSKIER